MITHNRREPIAYRLPVDAASAHRNRLTNWVNDLIDEAQAMSLEPAFSGPTGTGKTFALLAMRDAHPLSFFIDWPEFVNDFVAYRFDLKSEDKGFFDPVHFASECHSVLLIDDVGAERDSVLGIEAFDRVVAARAKSGLGIIFTTNMSSDDLVGRYGERVASRLARMCKFIEMAGSDRRLERA